MNQRKSVATIDNPEFINLQPSDISPMISAADVKVCYVGQNRNGSFINKLTLTDMSKTLRGCPIVGYYKKDKEDFGDHGDQLIIDGDGVQFNKLTRPYGFIPLEAKVWFQFFEDTDEFGNTCIREYLMTQCYLWTGQFPECERVITNHNPQSMELDPDSMEGHWAIDNNSGLEFFIINDAIFSTLCILGEDVEPCFEGASFTEPEISSAFTLDSSFVKELFSMMQEFKYALNDDKGGLSMNNIETPVVEQNVENQEVEQQVAPAEQVIENSLNEQGENSELTTVENENNTEEEFAKKDDNEEKPGSEESDGKEEEDEDKDKKPNNKNSLENIEVSDNFKALQDKFDELQEKFALLEKENSSLVAFKNEVESNQKDELIASFYMLSDEDKKDVIANKDKYSLEDIKKELSVICFDKKVNFNAEEKTEKVETPPAVFNLNSHQADELPAWLKCVDEVRNRNN